MPGYILTGAPGAGKTAVLRLLEVNGHVVVEEAATDTIALDHALGHGQPWHDHTFIDRIVTLQRQRRNSVPTGQTATVFFDRSPVCTLALSRYLGFAPSRLLAGEVERAVAEGLYETTVFFVRNQGFVQTTAARRISFEDSLLFEQLHEQTYRDFGFHLIEVPAGPLTDRVSLVWQTVERLRR
jgi:predicted ATPase